MVPDTRYAILGLLSRGPSHGYELAKRFGELLGPGWEINRGQVYDMLGRLEHNGLIERLGPPETAQGSQSYRITPTGERAFAKWRAKHASRSRAHRDPLYLKLVLAGPENAQHLLKDIEIEKQACIDKLNAYRHEKTACLPENADEWETLAREAIDEDVTDWLDRRLLWLEKLRKRVEHRLVEHPQDIDHGATDDQPRRGDMAA
jgi:DNA-binding PadR family transcriptional regulator